MCIGVPMQVLEAADGHAWCGADGHRERLDMAIVGVQAPGTWVLAFHGTARRVLGAAEAEQARAGRRALAAVLQGDADVDSFFADLVGRTPELPAHLRPDPP